MTRAGLMLAPRGGRRAPGPLARHAQARVRHSTFWKGNSSSMSRAAVCTLDWVTLARGGDSSNPGEARPEDVVTPAGLEDFFLEIGREASKEIRTGFVGADEATPLLQFEFQGGIGCSAIRFGVESCKPRTGSSPTKVPAQANREAARSLMQATRLTMGPLKTRIKKVIRRSQFVESTHQGLEKLR